jgi:hypothetical protein
MGLSAAVHLCRTLQPEEISLILREGLARDVNVRVLADAGSNVVQDSVLGPKFSVTFTSGKVCSGKGGLSRRRISLF